MKAPTLLVNAMQNGNPGELREGRATRLRNLPGLDDHISLADFGVFEVVCEHVLDRLEVTSRVSRGFIP
jgi:hypothetical protein